MASNEDVEVSSDQLSRSERLRQLSQSNVDALVRYGSRLANASKWTKGFMIVIGAGLAGGGQFIPDENLGRLVGWIGVIMAGLGGVWSLFVDESAPQLLIEAHVALETAKDADRESADKDQLILDLRYELGRAADLYVTNKIMRELAERQIADGAPDIGKSIQDLINLITRKFRSLMRVISGEYWTLSVYRFEAASDEKPERLIYIAGDRSEVQDGLANHREWGVGEGIAGRCFQIAKELIIEDASDPDQVSWMHVPRPLARDHDINKYLSFAAVPVSISGLDRPWGVIVATSDRPSCFEMNGDGLGSDAIEPLRMFQGMVALLAAHYHSKGAA